MLLEHTDYRLYLKEVLAERIRSRRGYSMRKLAKECGLAHSSMSEVLNGKSNLSAAAAHRTAATLSLSSRETDYFCALVEEATAKEPTLREGALRRRNEIRARRRNPRMLDMRQFRLVSEWYSFAVLGLAALSDFEFTAENVARRLGITKLEADITIQNLLQLGALIQEADGKIRRSPDDILARSETRDEAMLSFYRSMFPKAMDAIETQDPGERVTGFETIPIDTDLMPEARAIIEECFTRIVGLSTKSPARKSVYHLCIHFFDLAKSRKELS